MVDWSCAISPEQFLDQIFSYREIILYFMFLGVFASLLGFLAFSVLKGLFSRLRKIWKILMENLKQDGVY